jgi:hypothetical protein
MNLREDTDGGLRSNTHRGVPDGPPVIGVDGKPRIVEEVRKRTVLQIPVFLVGQML